MKVDAHCAFAQGFDRILLEDITPDMTIVPIMRNLHAFDWVCPMDIGVIKDHPVHVWNAESRPRWTWYGSQSRHRKAQVIRFDKSLHFQYWGEYKRKQIGDLVETMSLQGSCWMVTREKYFELDLCDENHGSLGTAGR